jgi:hypothetical protein
MRILLGVPCARVIRSQFVADLYDWIADSKHEIQLRADTTSGRIDWSRSNIMERAKKMRADVCIQMDADVMMGTPMRETLSYIQQDFSRGFDAVCGPTIGVNGRVMIKYMPDVDQNGPVSGKSAFEVEACAYGFVAFSRKLIETLKPAGFITDISGVVYPLYTHYSTDTTEDWIMCRRIREQGMKVCVDPRIVVGHVKEVILRPKWFDIPSPEGVQVGTGMQALDAPVRTDDPGQPIRGSGPGLDRHA